MQGAQPNNNHTWSSWNEVKHAPRKKDLANTRENSRPVALDDFEYPELGDATVKSKNCVALREHRLPSPTLETLVPIQLDVESKTSKSLKRYKRSDRICINLQEALQNTLCASKMDKRVHMLRINLGKTNFGIIIPNTLETNPEFRRVRMTCIAKNKRLSRLKKLILLHDPKRINAEKREEFELRKKEAICREVDTINFNALKITPDPGIDVNYVRNMCTMTLYDKNYRTMNEIGISDDIVCHRPDMIQKISKLKIQGGRLANRLIESSNPSEFSHLDIDVIENDIIKQTLSLKIEDGIKQEVLPQITEIDDTNSFKFSRNFREYCTNIITKELNASLEICLREIARLQKRFHNRYPNKSNYKRRYYSGLKEVRKHVELGKLKLVLIAPDIEKLEFQDGLDDQIEKLLDACRRQNVVFCFGLRRRKLGYYTHGHGLVGCVGIANYSGTEPLFKNVLTELVHARNAFEKLNGATNTAIDISKTISDDQLLSEMINALLKALSHKHTL